MKHSKTLLLVFAVLIFGFAFVSAQAPQDRPGRQGAPPQDRPAAAQIQRGLNATGTPTRTQARFDDVRRQRMEQYFGNMTERLRMHLRNLSRLADRIEALLNRFAEKGKNVDAHRQALVAAREKIIAAETALNMATSSLSQALQGDGGPRERFVEVRQIVAGVVEKIRDAHRSLVEIISSIRGASGRVRPEQTSTPTSTQ